MLAYYAPPFDSMQSLHYEQAPSSSSTPFQPFNACAADLSAYFGTLDHLHDSQEMAQPATQQPNNPPIQVQQSIPPAGTRTGNKMVRPQNNVTAGAWANSGNVGLLSPVHLQQSSLPQRTGGHTRATCGPVTSVAPSSPLSYTRPYPQIASSESSYSPSASHFIDSYEAPHPKFPKSLPTPIDTPVSTSFFPSDFNSYPTTPHDTETYATHMAMRRAIFDQAPADDDAGSYQHSVAQSVSSMSHNSPKTPMTSLPDDFDDGSKTLQTGETKLSDVDRWMDEYLRLGATSDYTSQTSSMKRSMSDMYQDDIFTADSPASAPQQKQRHSMSKGSGQLYRNMLAERIQLAQQGHARSQSPSTPISGEMSPFRQGSLYATQPQQLYASQRSPKSRINSASQLREQQKASEDAMEIAQHQRRVEEVPKTISPKDAVYEYRPTPEDAKMPLFPQEQRVPQYHSPYPNGLSLQQAIPSQQSYGGISISPESSTNFSTSAYGYLPSQPPNAQGYSFANSLIPPESGMHNTPEQTPDFAAHLQAMGSPGSDAMTATGSIDTLRPADASSDTGTYSCTYHGCLHRFETPAKLQKHKREAHRQTTPSGVNSAAAAARNSQAGPHKCTRINPATSKPCNSEFSRPYDLTRHEDTIHNSRKMKVRCAFCTEEKMFSRSDALTRHMRVVHPDINWPGKTKRKNARD